MMDKLFYYYKTGTEGVKIIYFSVIASVVYWILEFIFQKIFNVSVGSFFLLSSHAFIPNIWTFLTFPIFYVKFMDLLFGCVMIYYTEKIFRLYFNGESFLKFFILGNWVGGILFLLFGYATSTYGYLSGSILGVYSCLFAIISYNPKMKVTLFLLPIEFPLYILGIVIVGLDLLQLSAQPGGGGFLISRVSAAIFGYLYMRAFQSGNDFLGKFIPSFHSLMKVKNLFKLRQKSHLKKEKGGGKTNTFDGRRPMSDEEFNRNKVQEQNEINAILDKISERGYENLTKEEKDILFKFKK
ncbi:hypothetical protein ETU08_05605 [Apibacter muscae]|uniref:DUF6576 domain-containing protein n=1 Tax=Apibacter muscae TaxID=2509004 RepID=UPI0011ACFC31|nr:DUF6576 domain-containing protein [Apibacter muscae]TWP30033.1 hypothetical protein ETU08_05605 [Apibacter muscae]